MKKINLADFYALCATTLSFIFTLQGVYAQSAQTSELNSSPQGSESVESVAAELANPLAPITTFFAQYRLELDNGPKNETNHQLRFQPSFKPLDADSAFLVRTTFPIRFTKFPIDDAGIGDFSITPYYVPNIKSSTFIGYGGSLVFPTASEDSYGSEKWSAGPAVILAQIGDPIVYGGLLQHVWSYAGSNDRTDVSAATVQPFATYLIGGGWTSTLTSESTYNYEADTGQRWNVPITLGLGKVVQFGSKFVNLGLAFTHYPEHPQYATENEVRLNFTYVIR